MASKDCQEGGIVFGDWKLLPVDGNNWELCHRHATKETSQTVAAGTAGVIRWNRCGRFYQYNTLGNALRYAADVELKEGSKDKAMAIAEALDRYESIVREHLSEIAGVTEGKVG